MKGLFRDSRKEIFNRERARNAAKSEQPWMADEGELVVVDRAMKREVMDDLLVLRSPPRRGYGRAGK